MLLVESSGRLSCKSFNIQILRVSRKSSKSQEVGNQSQHLEGKKLELRNQKKSDESQKCNESGEETSLESRDEIGARTLLF